MKKILSSKKPGVFAGLVIGICLMGISDMAFATNGGTSGYCELPTLTYPTPTTVSGRSFQLHEPPGSPDNAPLIIDVHAYTGNWENQACNTRYWEKTADQAYIVYPIGTPDPRWWMFGVLSYNGGDGGPGYNGCCGWAMDTDLDGNLIAGVDDVQYIKEIVLYMVDHYNIDPTRIYGSGLSNGSAMIQRMIIEEPDLFAAIFVSSQHLLELPHQDQNEPPLPQVSVPVMLSYGLDDNTYNGRIGNNEGVFPRGEETFKRWARLNGCIDDETVGPYAPPDPTYLPGARHDGTDYVSEPLTPGGSQEIGYRGCPNDGSILQSESDGATYADIDVEMWLVNGNHSHYKDTATTWGLIDTDLDIAQIGWEFMKQYKRSAPADFITQR